MPSYYITTPIYYVNAKAHLGHAYTTIVADCLNRFHKLMGFECKFLTGTDEHGDKIVQAAEKMGLEPQAFVDKISKEFKDLWPLLRIEHDDFIRTTSPEHKKSVQSFMQKIYDSGDIYFGEFGGHYCYGCERFYTEKELENGLCPQHLNKPEFISEKNYFFRMSKYLPWLLEHIKNNPDFIRPERYKNEVLAMLENNVLEDLCISRPKSRLTWGIELPFDKDYVCYVWFDALVNYISALGWTSSNEGSNEEYQKFWPGQHLVAKDILKPHAIFWPTMLKAANLPIYKNLNVHGYWLVRDTKMSKSLYNVIDPIEMSNKFGIDAFRYYLMREMNFGSDASFNEDNIITRINADLSNALGNLFSRVLSMCTKYFNSITPAAAQNFNARDEEILALANTSLQKFTVYFAETKFTQALDALWELVRALNKYVDNEAPWTIYAQGNQERLADVLYLILEMLRKIALHIWPIMPDTAITMLQQLGQKIDKNSIPTHELFLEAKSFGTLQAGTILASASNLFPRIETNANNLKYEQDKNKALSNNKAAKKIEHKANDKPNKMSDKMPNKIPDKKADKKVASSIEKSTKNVLINFDDFQKVEIKIGTILIAEKHPNADKLLRLEIDLGEENPRQIISGLAEYFTPESLIGQQVCVVVNLAPRKIRGLESCGMVLTAEKDNKLSLLTVTMPMPNGSTIS